MATKIAAKPIFYLSCCFLKAKLHTSKTGNLVYLVKLDKQSKWLLLRVISDLILHAFHRTWVYTPRFCISGLSVGALGYVASQLSMPAHQIFQTAFYSSVITVGISV